MKLVVTINEQTRKNKALTKEEELKIWSDILTNLGIRFKYRGKYGPDEDFVMIAIEEDLTDGEVDAICDLARAKTCALQKKSAEEACMNLENANYAKDEG